MANDIAFISAPVNSADAGLTKFSSRRRAVRTTFRPVPGEPSILYAKIHALPSGDVTGITLRLVNGETPTGQVLLTTVDPAFDLNGAHLLTFVEGIVPAATGGALYRRLNLVTASYSTIGLSDKPGDIYAMIVGGPAVPELLADIGLVIKARS
jgi:hypothetical protein